MKPKLPLMIAVALLIILFATGAVAAARLADYSLPWWTVDSGGGASSNGGYALSGTIGQGDATTTMSNGSYAISGGFWQKDLPINHLYLPLLLR